VAIHGSAAAFVTGLTLSASLIVAIGAQNTFVLRQGLRREHVAAIVAVCVLLDFALMSIGVAGLAASLGRHPRALHALAIAGALLLAAYGAAALRRALQPQALLAAAAGAAGTTRPLGRVLMQALAISLLNPHVYLDTVVLVGAVGARQPPGMQGAFLIGAGLASAVWFTALGYGARALAPLFARPVAWRVLDVVIAATMWSLAAGLASGVFVQPAA
jgi:L-lysine exporter family protein LysE/ArgO